MDISIELDFDKQVIKGFNILTLYSQKDFMYDIYLDVKGMDIQKVTDVTGTDLTWIVSKQNPNLGDALHIFLSNPINKGKWIDIVVHFQTNDKQTATSWLTKEQTLGKEIPYMFTQCEAIHCRSVIPMMDTPAIKATYDVEVKTIRSVKTFISGNMTKETFLDQK